MTEAFPLDKPRLAARERQEFLLAHGLAASASAVASGQTGPRPVKVVFNPESHLLAAELVPALVAAAEGLPELRELHLRRLYVLSAIDVDRPVARLTQLRELTLSRRGLGPAVAGALAGGCLRLEALDLSENRVGDEGATALAALTALRRLDLAANGVGDAGAAALAGSLASLADLDLARVRGPPAAAVTDAGCAALAAGLPRLARLSLSGCAAVTPAGARALAARLTALESLDLGDCVVRDAGCSALAQALPALAHLGLRGAGVSAAGAQALARGLPALQTLDVSGCRLGAAGAVELAAGAPAALRSLRCGGCGVGGTGALALAMLPGLTALDLSPGDDLSDADVRLLAAALRRRPRLRVFMFDDDDALARQALIEKAAREAREEWGRARWAAVLCLTLGTALPREVVRVVVSFV